MSTKACLNRLDRNDSTLRRYAKCDHKWYCFAKLDFEHLCGETKRLCHTLEAFRLDFGNVRVWPVLSIKFVMPQRAANGADGIEEADVGFLVPSGGIGTSALTKQTASLECDETV